MLGSVWPTSDSRGRHWRGKPSLFQHFAARRLHLWSWLQGGRPRQSFSEKSALSRNSLRWLLCQGAVFVANPFEHHLVRHTNLCDDLHGVAKEPRSCCLRSKSSLRRGSGGFVSLARRPRVRQCRVPRGNWESAREIHHGRYHAAMFQGVVRGSRPLRRLSTGERTISFMPVPTSTAAQRASAVAASAPGAGLIDGLAAARAYPRNRWALDVRGACRINQPVRRPPWRPP